MDSQIAKKINLPPNLKLELLRLSARNNWYNFFAIGFDWILIVGAIVLSEHFQNPIAYFLTLIIIGSRMRGLDNIMHEASHHMLFRNPTVNKVIACIFAAYPVFTSFDAYTRSHRLHHKYLWDSDKDPDTKRYRIFGLDRPPRRFIDFLTKHLLKPMTLIHVPHYFLGTLHVNLFTRSETLIEKLARVLYWTILVGVCWYLGWLHQLTIYWLVPFFTTFQVIRYWVEMAEHSGLETNDPLQSSRNSFGSLVERFLLQPHHDSYHLVHHLYPGIPHFNLKKAHLILMQSTEYRSAHHCAGFFKSSLPGFASVIDDIRGINIKPKDCAA